MIPQLAPHSTALVTELEVTGLPVGRGQKPDGAGWQGSAGQSTFVAYLVLHAIPGGTLDGSLAEPDDDLAGIWQVTAVGATAEQCELAADAARTRLLTVAPTIAGRFVMRLYVEALSGVRPDTTVVPTVFISTDQFRLATTPA